MDGSRSGWNSWNWWRRGVQMVRPLLGRTTPPTPIVSFANKQEKKDWLIQIPIELIWLKCVHLPEGRRKEMENDCVSIKATPWKRRDVSGNWWPMMVADTSAPIKRYDHQQPAATTSLFFFYQPCRFPLHYFFIASGYYLNYSRAARATTTSIFLRP